MKLRASVFALTLVIAVHSNVAFAQWMINGVPLNTAVGNQGQVATVSDGAGGAIAAWIDGRGASIDIYVQRVDVLGIPQWMHDGVDLCVAGGTQENPVIASDGAGGAIVAWTDYRSGLSKIYAQRVDASGLPLWTPDGVAICTAPSAELAVIDADGAGGAIIAWRDNRFQNIDVFAQRVSATGVPQWTTNGVVVCDEPNLQTVYALIADGTGGAIVAWQDHRSGTDTDIYAQRLNAFGEPKWAPGGVGICTEAEPQQGPAMAPDGAGGAILAWEDGRSMLISEIYAQRVSATGDPQWTAGGVVICSQLSSRARIISDGVGGAIITWRDPRHCCINDDVYVQRVNAAGEVLWMTDGVPVCTEVGEQRLPELVTDGAEGAIVTWFDERGGFSEGDIYAQRVDAAGVPQWPTNGVVLCAADYEQFNPQIVSDGVGGAIVAWNDARVIGTDIYAQRILFYGGVPTSVGDTPAPTLVLDPNFPNPFSSETTIDLSPIATGAVEVEVFDVAGRRVRAIKLDRVDAGSKRMSFDGRDEAGQLLPSGVYFYRVRANGATVTRKMVIAR